jgi:hypothetical protein
MLQNLIMYIISHVEYEKDEAVKRRMAVSRTGGCRCRESGRGTSSRDLSYSMMTTVNHIMCVLEKCNDSRC